MSESNLSLIAFLRIIAKWRKPVILFTLVIFGGSIIFSLLLPDYFKSTASFYPYSINASDPREIFKEDEKVDLYPSEDDFDRIIAIGNSRRLHTYLAERFNLYDHYGIDTTTTATPYTDLIKEFSDNYTIEETIEGIKITVYDKNKHFASEMANAIVKEIDLINGYLIRNKNKKLAQVYDMYIKERKDKMQGIREELEELRKDYTVQDLILEQQILSESGISEANFGHNSESLKENIQLVKQLELEFEGISEDLATVQGKYEQALTSLKYPFNTLFVIEQAHPAEKKARPHRTLIVLGSTFFGFLLACLAVIVFESYRKEVDQINNEPAPTEEVPV